MKFNLFCAVLASVVAVPTIAMAQGEAAPAAATSLQVDSGAKLFSSDGKWIGKIQRVAKEKDGTPRSVAVIYGSRFVYVPYSTLSQGEKGVVTSLTRAQVGKLK